MAFETYQPRQEPERSQGTLNATLEPIPNLQNIGAENIRKGIDVLRTPHYESDTSAGTLFKGLAHTLDTAITAVDDVNKIQIQRETQATLNKIRDQHGVAEALSQAQQEGSGAIGDLTQAAQDGVPVALNRLGTRLKGLQEAYNQGTFGDSHFYTQAEIAVRQLKDKYPGYTDHIDKVVHNSLGVVPANAVRRAIQNDLEKLNNKIAAQLDKRETKILEWLPVLPSDFIDRQTGKSDKPPYTWEETVSMVQSRKAEEQDVKDAHAKLNLDKAQGKDVQSNAERTATGILSKDVINFMQEANTKGVNKLLDDISKSGKLPPGVDPQQVAMEFDNHMRKFEAGLDIKMNSPGPNGEQSLFQLMGSDKLRYENIKKQVMAPLQGIKDSLTNPTTGIGKMYSNMAEQARDKYTYDQFKNNNTWQKLDFLRRTGGDNAVNLAIGSSAGGKFATDYVKALNHMDIIDASTPPEAEGTKGLGDAAKRREKAGQNNGASHKGMLDTLIAPISNPEVSAVTPMEQRIRNANYLYNDQTHKEYVANFPANQQQRIYDKLFNPNVTKELLKMKDTGPEGIKAWENYSKQAELIFNDVFKVQADTLASVKNRRYVDLIYDPKNAQFTLVHSEEGKAFMASKHTPGILGQGMVALEAYLTKDLKQPIANINKALSTIKPIMEANNVPAENVLPVLLNSMGVDTSGGGAKADTLWNMMFDALGVTGKKPGKQSSYDLNKVSTDPLKGLLQSAESSQHGYSTMFGMDHPVDFENMSIGEVKKLQKAQVAAGHESGAAGRYQFINSTLNRLQDKLGIPDTEKFNRQTQDKLADALIEEQGLSKYKSGQITREQFAENLAGQWAGLPSPKTGKSVYQGVGSNRANVSVSELLRTIGQL